MIVLSIFKDLIKKRVEFCGELAKGVSVMFGPRMLSSAAESAECSAPEGCMVLHAVSAAEAGVVG